MAPTMLLRRLLPVLLVSLALPACSAPSPSASSSEPASSSPSVAPSIAPSEAEPSAAASASASAGPQIREPAEEPPPLALEAVGEGFASPIGIAPAPDGWLLVNERDGRVRALDPASGETRLVLDIADRVDGGGEQGLLGLAFHPDWPEVTRAFVHYTDGDGDTVLSEMAGRVESGAPFLDPRTEAVLLTADQPYGNHNGGQLAFGPDGHLWMALGDGGSGGDPEGNGQDPNTILGAILRLDVSEPGSVAIPDDNPYADGGGAPEVVLTGLRNPWRFSFDPATGELWIADVGQNAYEEVNRLDPVADAGANLGWNVMEGVHCFADADCSSDGLLLPITEYGRDRGCSVTGGGVYRGEAIGGLWGWYLFSDYCSGTVFGIPSDAQAPAPGAAVEPRVLLETSAAVSAFGVDSAGELYLADLGAGTIYRIVGG
jgi:glucose/arabinose dehydrogenase